MKLSDFNNNNNNNKKGSNKLLDNFQNRLEKVEAKKGIRNNKHEETDSEIEWRFAKYREARAKERYGPAPGGILTYGDVWDDITNEEIDYYSGKSKPKEKRGSPEVRYQKRKEEWWSHESSWTARGIDTGYDAQGCNGFTGCVPECRYYTETGRIEDEEVFARWEEVRRKRDSMTKEEKREERQRVHNYNLVYDDDTPEQRLQWQQKREKWQQEHPGLRQWF